MKQVFISYSSKEAEKAQAVATALEVLGIYCWIAPRDIPAGGNYTVEIPKAIGECAYFVLLLSNKAQSSKYVMAELDQAYKRGKVIIPIQLEDMEQNESINFLLSMCQSVDATKDFKGALQQVVSRILLGDVDVQDLPCEKNSPKIQKERRKMVCPHCGGKVVKKQRLWTDKYLYPDKDLTTGEKRWIWFMRRQNIWLLLCMCWVTVNTFIWPLARNTFANEVVDVTAEHGAIFCIVSVFLLVSSLDLCQKIVSHKLAPGLLEAVENSKMKHYTLKCMSCEKTFGVLIPEADELKDWVSVLVEETANKELQT